jgi:Rps23 Pro-64 3,4-dihydroxylase Tpa1-like proline 4-hydroxylase
MIKKNKIIQNIFLENYIKIYDNIISDDLCDEIIEEYEKSEEWEKSSIRNSVYCNIENHYDVISISNVNTILKNIVKRKKNDELIYEIISNAKNSYTEEFKYLDIEFDTGFDLIRYKKGQFYRQHTDDFKGRQRSIACSIYLNNNYEGGELAFFDRQKIIKCKKGSILMFPSNFMYPYEIMPVLNGIRYSIETWLI